MASISTWCVGWLWIKRFLILVGVVSLLVIVAVLSHMDFSADQPHILTEHPYAQWQGGVDGGQFIEVTKSEPPYYFVQVRYESGGLWDEGWVKYGEKGDEPLTPSDVIAFSGGGVIYLQQRKVLNPNKPKLTSDF